MINIIILQNRIYFTITSHLRLGLNTFYNWIILKGNANQLGALKNILIKQPSPPSANLLIIERIGPVKHRLSSTHTS